MADSGIVQRCPAAAQRFFDCRPAAESAHRVFSGDHQKSGADRFSDCGKPGDTTGAYGDGGKRFDGEHGGMQAAVGRSARVTGLVLWIISPQVTE